MTSPTPSFATHHVAISVRSLERTAEFYKLFGFRLVVRWEASDGSLCIAHLLLGDDTLLEVFAYASNASQPPLEVALGNDLEAIGVKHFGVRVSDSQATHRRLEAQGADRLTPVKRGRTGIDYFFVRDPDGLWVEVVQDDRVLDGEQPIYLRQGEQV